MDEESEPKLTRIVILGVNLSIKPHFFEIVCALVYQPFYPSCFVPQIWVIQYPNNVIAVTRINFGSRHCSHLNAMVWFWRRTTPSTSVENQHAQRLPRSIVCHVPDVINVLFFNSL